MRTADKISSLGDIRRRFRSETEKELCIENANILRLGDIKKGLSILRIIVEKPPPVVPSSWEEGLGAKREEGAMRGAQRRRR
jgi:hypothetical protein